MGEARTQEFSAVMFGVESFYDGACWRDYDPWAHAEMLGAPVVANSTLPGQMVAAYSRRRGLIFVRPRVRRALPPWPRPNRA